MNDFRLEMNRLACDKTTDQGADEIVIYILGVSNQGRVLALRYPESGHVDMNDGDQPTDNHSGDSHLITHNYFGLNEILKATAQDEEVWSFVLSIVEEDGGSTASAQEIAASILMQIPTLPTLIGGAVMSLVNTIGLKAFDSNDYIGSVGLDVSSIGGAFNFRYYPLDRVGLFSVQDNWPNRLECRLIGDGANYLLDLRLDA